MGQGHSPDQGIRQGNRATGGLSCSTCSGITGGAGRIEGQNPLREPLGEQPLKERLEPGAALAVGKAGEAVADLGDHKAWQEQRLQALDSQEVCHPDVWTRPHQFRDDVGVAARFVQNSTLSAIGVTGAKPRAVPYFRDSPEGVFPIPWGGACTREP